MVLLVHGFPSKIAALQFEWAWQNPHLSRQAPDEAKLPLRRKVEGKTRYAKPRLSMKRQIEILREMLGFEGWRKWPLQVSILDEEAQKVWDQVGEKENVRDVQCGIVGDDVVEVEPSSEPDPQNRKRDLNLKKLVTLDLTDCIIPYERCLIVAQFLTRHNAKSSTLLPKTRSNSAHACDICRTPLPASHLEIALCPRNSCTGLFHLTCLASQLADADSILPVKGNCPSCKKEILWGDVIRGVFGRAGQVEDTDGIDDDLADDEDEEDEEEEDIATTPKSKATSKGKRKPSHKGTTVSRRQAGKGKSTELDVVYDTDRETTPQPAKATRRTTKPKAKAATTNPTTNKSDVSKTKDTSESLLMIPDSASEANDVWVISSGED